MSAEKERKRSESADAAQTAKRGGKAQAIAQMVPKLTKAALGKRGLAQANLIVDWPNIVGQDRAATCQPEKLTFARGHRNNGTLHLRVSGSAALELQHDAPQLIDRINGYFGYAAVAEIRLIQAPLKKPEKPGVTRPHRTPTAEEMNDLKRGLNGIEDSELRETLTRLGTAILSESGESTKN